MYSENNKLLALEEVGLKVLDFNGKILQDQIVDLIDTFELNNGVLSICTMDGEEKEISLAI